jgi:5-methylthioribose kinase
MESMTVETALAESLCRMGLVRNHDRIRCVRLAGGVSSDIWRVDIGERTVCVKRALETLRVESDWNVPVRRSRSEIAWMRVVHAIVPAAVPRIIADDPDSNCFAMEFLDERWCRNWKAMLEGGDVDARHSSDVARCLATIHARTSADTALRSSFETDDLFFALRLKPYLLATADRHPDIAGVLRGLADVTARTKKCLVHGDVSPKNILIRDGGPVFLDAECAWYGDPAFDLAFCLNHLLLKCLRDRFKAKRYVACFEAMVMTYRQGITWEAEDAVERRAARLLPGLFIARIDGMSPVDYVVDAKDKACVRRVAKRFLNEPTARLSAIADAWLREVGRA